MTNHHDDHKRECEGGALLVGGSSGSGMFAFEVGVKTNTWDLRRGRNRLNFEGTYTTFTRKLRSGVRNLSTLRTNLGITAEVLYKEFL